MNKVLMGGLATGKDVGVCAACNFDFWWLLAYPATLVWADSVIVTPTIWERLSSGDWPYDWPEIAKSLKVVFQLAKDRGVVEVRDPVDTITPELASEIWVQAETDRELH